MSQPEIERQLTQNRDDVAALYEIVEDFRQQTLTRFDTIDARFDAHDARFDRIDENLAEILGRLPG